MHKLILTNWTLTTTSRWLNSMLLHSHVIITTRNSYLPSSLHSTGFLLWFNLQKEQQNKKQRNMRKLKVDRSLNIPYEPFYCPLSSSPQFSTLFPFLPSLLALWSIQNAHTYIPAETGYPSDQRSLWSCYLNVCEILSNIVF